MSTYFATKCQSCAEIQYQFITRQELDEQQLDHVLSACDKCYEFPKVLYVTENISEARAYNEIIALVG